MTRLAAVGGIVGPVGFAGAWLVSGLATAGYAPATRAISDLAATTAPTRWAMTAGMVMLGIGLIVDSWAVRATTSDAAGLAVLVSGGATLGVAAVPLGGGSDGLHGAFAGLGYLTLAAAPALAARPLAATGHPVGARASLVLGAACGLCLLVTIAGPAHGLFQRLGLLIGHTWIGGLAIATLVRPDRARRGAAPPGGPGPGSP